MFEVTVDFHNGKGIHVKWVKGFSDLASYLEWIQSTIDLDANGRVTINIKTISNQIPALLPLPGEAVYRKAILDA